MDDKQNLKKRHRTATTHREKAAIEVEFFARYPRTGKVPRETYLASELEDSGWDIVTRLTITNYANRYGQEYTDLIWAALDQGLAIDIVPRCVSYLVKHKNLSLKTLAEYLENPKMARKIATIQTKKNDQRNAAKRNKAPAPKIVLTPDQEKPSPGKSAETNTAPPDPAPLQLDQSWKQAWQAVENAFSDFLPPAASQFEKKQILKEMRVDLYSSWTTAKTRAKHIENGRPRVVITDLIKACKILEIKYPPVFKEAKTKYRACMSNYHPDKGDETERVAQLFREAQWAWKIIVTHNPL